MKTNTRMFILDALGSRRDSYLTEELVSAQATEPGYPRYLLGAAHFSVRCTRRPKQTRPDGKPMNNRNGGPIRLFI